MSSEGFGYEEKGAGTSSAGVGVGRKANGEGDKALNKVSFLAYGGTGWKGPG